MVNDELESIKEIWEKKYPSVNISLWSSEDDSRYYGKMMAKDICQDIASESIAGLIELGELFLRKVIK